MGVKAALSGKGFWSYYSDRQQNVYSAYTKKNYRCMFNQS